MQDTLLTAPAPTLSPLEQPAAPDQHIVNDNAAVYYQGSYWNDYAYVRERINERICDAAETAWFEHFHQLVGRRRFRKALILCCGNGWVERELWQRGFFEEAVGVDYAESLLVQARAAAEDRPLRYYQMDINTAAFPEDGFDLVINYAAAHHIAYLDHVFRTIARLLPEDGYFVSYDYVGPHRNQYPALQFAAARSLNDALPKHVRQDLRYPHLPTMLALDPTEAIHSELIVQVLRRYFTTVTQRHAGGALAYPLITHNQQLARASAEEQQRWVGYIMDADGEYLDAHPETSLFDYIVAQPNKAALTLERRLAAWTLDEQQREQAAREQGGRYYELPATDDDDSELHELRRERDWRRATMDDLLRERRWLLQRNAELEAAIEQIHAHPALRVVRTLRRPLRRR